jgi:23S rRNA pseudouridine955/2504/2580 synthase
LQRSQVRYIRVLSTDAGMRLDNFLLREFKNVPKSRVYKIIRSGEVRVNRSRARPGTRLAAADNIRLPPVRQPAPSDPGRPPDGLIAKVQAAIVAETADYMVLSKPAGLAVHAGSGLRFGLIEVLRAARPDEYFELVHRLDRQTSGCLLVARNRPALTELRAGLGVATARKHYRALVEGRWRHGEIEVDAPLARDVERAGERVVTVDPAGGRPSLSVFRPLHFYAEATWMAVTIHTGRTHQIRVHAAHCGHPVAGDAKYGSNARATAWRQRGLARMALHAESVALDFRGHRRVFEAPLAADLAGLVGSLDAAR